MHVFSIFGLYREGYLHGEDLAMARRLAARGYKIAVQGPSISNRDSDLVTLLSSCEDGGWTPHGLVELYDAPETPEAQGQ